ncbi:condensation domain-containing protein [Streptomyces sp. SAI-127]|uniref:condensation domain-containing protein n=1 Tax=Streptomyces sp. SAI-127 TaxID=2940543 RepID=UPI0024748486|nr:condensation domain-containing protein [Streptomyces sp. SAI-127]
MEGDLRNLPAFEPILAGPSTIHTVQFSGSGHGTYPLTWSQEWLWRGIVLTAPNIERMNLGRIVPVPSGLPLGSTLRAISALMHRHEALRTRFHLDERGRPRQVVADRGELTVEEYEAAGADCRDVARAVKERLCAAPFTAPEVSLRVALITEEQRPVMLVLCAFHMATDAWGAGRIVDDLTSIMGSLRDGIFDLLSSFPTQVHERLEFEQGAQGVRCSERSLEYWGKQISRFPENSLPAAEGKPDGAPFREISMDSAALAATCRALAQRAKVGVGAVFIGLTATLLSAINGNAGVGFLVFTHNRYGRNWAKLSGPLVQDFPLYVEVAGRTLLEVARDIDQTTLSGSFYGQYNPTRLPSLLSSVSGSLGFNPDLSCAVNTKLSRESGPSTRERGALKVAAPQDVERLTGETRIDVGAGLHREDMNLFFSIDCRTHRAEILMRANTRIFSTSQMRDFLRNLEGSSVLNLTGA